MRTGTTQRGSREFDELAPYLKAVRDYPPLSREEEHAAAVRARKGDVAAKQKLVRHNLAFVVAIARKQRRGTVRLDDLIQEGNVGLMRAVEKFDPHAGTRFSTYAVWWIRAYVGKYLKEARSTVRPQSGTVAQPDLSLDSSIDEEGDATHLERIEDDGPGPGGHLPARPRATATSATRSARSASASASSAGTSSTTGSSRTSRARSRRSASAGASPASGSARWSSRPSSSWSAT